MIGPYISVGTPLSGTYTTRLQDEPREKKGGLKRSNSSPNIAKMMEDEGKQLPSVDRTSKPIKRCSVFEQEHFYSILNYFSESRSSNGSTPCPSISTCTRYIIKLAICTAVFSEVWVRLELVQHGVIGLKWACWVNLVSLTP